MSGYVMSKHNRLFKKERGNILVLFTIGLFALIAMAALALDGGHMLLNKTRLQNIADAAALHAAKTLDEGGTHQDARAAVIEIIALNLDPTSHGDNHEINDALELSVIDTSATQVTAAINVDFSERPDPFISSTSDDADYVKVEIRNLNLNNFLADILNFAKRISATALAGPSTSIEACPNDVVPMMICGDFSETAPADDENEDGVDDHIYGLPLEEVYVLKAGSTTIGPGSFQLARLGDNTGAADIRDAMAGASFTDAGTCESTLAIGDFVEPETGNTVGPSAQGINTRLGVYDGVMKGTEDEYQRDWNVCQGTNKVDVLTKQEAQELTEASTDGTVYQEGDLDPDSIGNAYRYLSYKNDGRACSNTSAATGTTGSIDTSLGSDQRRILKVIIADCTDQINPSDSVEVKGLGCFFLTQTMDGGNEDFIIGEFAFDCPSVGITSGVAENNPGPYTIVLYHVPGSNDS